MTIPLLVLDRPMLVLAAGAFDLKKPMLLGVNPRIPASGHLRRFRHVHVTPGQGPEPTLHGVVFAI